ncbi:MAG: hypothetical protein AAF654_06990 [Myxococcota bacterium]
MTTPRLLLFVLLSSCTAKPPIVPPGDGSLALTLTFSDPEHAKGATGTISDRLHAAGVAKYSTSLHGHEVQVVAEGFNPGATTFLTAISTTRGRVSFHRVRDDPEALMRAWQMRGDEALAGVVPQGAALVSESRGLIERAISVVALPGRKLVVEPPRPGETVFRALIVDEAPEMDGSTVRRVEAGERGGLVLVFSDAGAKAFAAVTEKLQGHFLAIVVDDQVWSAPVIREPIRDGRAVVSQARPFPVEEVRLWDLLLRMEPLPSAPVKVK